MVKLVSDLNIPILKLAYPTTRDEVINLIYKTNLFLKDLKTLNEVDVDLKIKKEKYPLSDFKDILDNLK